MENRGPDGAGAWFSPSGNAGLAHRRLAILDPTPAGAQPMASPDGRYHLVLNGEIYNFRTLRDELVSAGVVFRSHSDTEVLLALWHREGPALLARLRGMYALALWDEHDQTLFVARDPYGIKPLYYSTSGGWFRFASQVKALELAQGISRQLDPAALAGFLLWGAVPEPHTLRSDIRVLPAGTALLVKAGFGLREVTPPAPAAAPLLDPGAALADSVAAHLVSDVPVALFLSAGLDSALVAALAQRQHPEPLQTFTLRFEAFRHTSQDEGPLAAKVAGTLRTRHRERWVGASELAQLWPAVLAAMDQPSIDGANTYLISRLAAEAGLKVVLSGLGGDEIFGSYPSFRDVPRWACAARTLAAVPGARAAWPALVSPFATSRPKLPALLDLGRDLAGAYFLRRGLFLPTELPALLGPELAAAGLAAYDPVADARHVLSAEQDPWLAVHRLESGLYLKNQLLRDADWASMAHGLELRVPLVDDTLQQSLAAHRFEPARSRGKAALVQTLAPELPAELFTRPKTGFGLPLAALAGAGPAARQGLDARSLARRILQDLGVLPAGPGGVP